MYAELLEKPDTVLLLADVDGGWRATAWPTSCRPARPGWAGMRYVIIGAGAVGGTIGARLFENGHDVVLVAGGEHHAALRDGGLRFATPTGLVTLPVPVRHAPAAGGGRGPGGPDDRAAAGRALPGRGR